MGASVNSSASSTSMVKAVEEGSKVVDVSKTKEVTVEKIGQTNKQRKQVLKDKEHAGTLVTNAKMEEAIMHLARWVESQVKHLVDKSNDVTKIVDTMSVMVTAQADVLVKNKVCTKDDITDEMHAIIAKVEAEAEKKKVEAEEAEKKKAEETQPEAETPSK